MTPHYSRSYSASVRDALSDRIALDAELHRVDPLDYPTPICMIPPGLRTARTGSMPAGAHAAPSEQSMPTSNAADSQWQDALDVRRGLYRSDFQLEQISNPHLACEVGTASHPSQVSIERYDDTMVDETHVVEDAQIADQETAIGRTSRSIRPEFDEYNSQVSLFTRRSGGRSRRKSTSQQMVIEPAGMVGNGVGVQGVIELGASQRKTGSRSAVQVLLPGRRSHVRWLIGLVVVLIAVGIAGGWVLHRRRKAQRDLEQANHLLKSGQLQDLRNALGHLRSAAHLGGRNGDLVAYAALAHAQLTFDFGESDLERAKSLLDEARNKRRRTSSGEFALELARLYVALAGKPLPEALALIDASRAAHPDDVHLGILRGWVLLKNGQWQEAAAVAESIASSNYRLLHLRAELAFHSGRVDIARSILERAVAAKGLGAVEHDIDQARYAIAQGWYSSMPRNEVTGDESKNVGVRSKRRVGYGGRQSLSNSKSLRGRGKPVDVKGRMFPTLDDLLAARNHSELSANVRARLNSVIGALQRRYGKRRHAEVALERASQLAPVGDPDFRRELAVELLALGRSTLALRQVREARRIAPDRVSLIVLEGRILRYLGDAKRAAVQLRNRADLTTDMCDVNTFEAGEACDAQAVLAGVMIDTEQLDDAAAYLKRTKRRSDYARLVAAELALAKGHPYAARRVLAQASQHAQEDGMGLLLHARIALKLGHHSAAEQQLHMLLVEQPDNWRALTTLGALRWKQGKHVGSQIAYQRSLRAHPSQATARVALGRVFLAQRDPQKALTVLAAVAQRPDGARLIRRACRKLRSTGDLNPLCGRN